jgi:hypothetical protein
VYSALQNIVITPTADHIQNPFILNSATNMNQSEVAYIWKDDNTSGTTVYGEGITHTNGTSTFTTHDAGQYLINFFIRADDGASNNRIAGYALIRRRNSSGTIIADYPCGGSSYYRDDNQNYDDYVLTSATTLTFNQNDTFEIRSNRVMNEASGTIAASVSLSYLRIERIKYISSYFYI